MKSAFLLFCVLLALCGGMYSHKSSLGHQMESLELKKFITKMQTFNVEAQQWTPNLQGACSAEMEEEFVFYLKWTVVTFFILGFLNCAYLVLKDIHHTYTVYREAELAHIEEQRRRILDLKRRFNELVRNERIPGQQVTLIRMTMMNFKLILFFVFIIGFVGACLDYCPDECAANGCTTWVCETEWDCFCDDCYWFNEQLSLNEVARVKKDVLKAKLNIK